MPPCAALPTAPDGAIGTVGTRRPGKAVGGGRRSLRGFAESARFRLSDPRHGSNRGGDWAALALSGRLAPGVAALDFAKHAGPRTSVRGPVAFSPHPLLRRRLETDGRAQRLERLENQEAAHQTFQQRRRHPAQQVRRLRAAQVPFIDAVFGEADEQAAQAATANASDRRRRRRGETSRARGSSRPTSNRRRNGPASGPGLCRPA